MTLLNHPEQLNLPDEMPYKATVQVPTAKAGRYLKALCNHFARQATAHYSDSHGTVQFNFGRCEFQAQAQQLFITVSAASEENFARIKVVVADHLVRFAQQETLTVEWMPASA